MSKLQEKNLVQIMTITQNKVCLLKKNALCASDTHNTGKSRVNHAPFYIDNAPSLHPIGAIRMTGATGWWNILSC